MHTHTHTHALQCLHTHTHYDAENFYDSFYEPTTMHASSAMTLPPSDVTIINFGAWARDTMAPGGRDNATYIGVLDLIANVRRPQSI